MNDIKFIGSDVWQYRGYKLSYQGRPGAWTITTPGCKLAWTETVRSIREVKSSIDSHIFYLLTNVIKA